MNKKPKKLTSKELQNKIWIECRRVANLRYKNKKGGFDCYTCGANGLFGVNKQLGHMIPKSYCKPFMKYDMRNLRFQCMRCNVHMGGMGALFIERMRGVDGDMYVAEILNDLQVQMDVKDIYKYYQDQLEFLKLIVK